MMKRKKVIFTLFALLLCSTILSNNASANGLLTENLRNDNSNVNVVNFKNGEVRTIKEPEDIDYQVKEWRINYVDGVIAINLDINSNEIKQSFSIEALPYLGKLNTGPESTILGKELAINKGYEIASLRIEEVASSLTLMPVNIDLEGKIVLSLGIRSLETKDVYYFQTQLEGLDFNSILVDAQNNSSNVSDSELIELEERYLFLKESSIFKSERVATEVVVNDYDENESGEELLEFLNELEEKGEIYSPDIDPYGVVHQNVPDSIFKSGALDTWRHGKGSTYAYSFITSKYAGTDNRYTYIVYMEWIPQVNSSPYSATLRVVKNVAVLYNVSNNALRIESGNKNRIHVNNVKLSLSSNTEGGVFTSRKYWGVNNSSTLSKVVEAAVGWTNYPGKIVNTFTILSGSDLNANKKYTYQSTAAKQVAEYGKVISAINAKSSKIRYPDDYFSIEGFGNGIKSCTAKYEYTVTY